LSQAKKSFAKPAPESLSLRRKEKESSLHTKPQRHKENNHREFTKNTEHLFQPWIVQKDNPSAVSSPGFLSNNDLLGKTLVLF
jgi:predicted RNA-binding protein with RPS1 domain